MTPTDIQSKYSFCLSLLRRVLIVVENRIPFFVLIYSSKFLHSVMWSISY